ncbi:MAG: peptidoglycan DD-metalloendopeptidase family protein [Pseudomonadota bacterium]
MGCSSTPVQAPVSNRPTKATGAPPVNYVVRRGDTMYTIAWRYNLDYRSVAHWNGLAEPYRIYPGQRLTLRAPKRVVETRRKGVATAPGPTKKRPTKSTKSRKRSTPSRSSGSNGTKKVTWRSPTSGKVIRSFKQTRTGVDIAGKRGQTIRASASGRVVYSGSGLLGYGKLIILKHSTRFLTAYAHNSTILVSEGESVALGQPIATMGDSGTDRVMLHFEVRRDGKPVDPLRYVPNF